MPPREHIARGGDCNDSDALLSPGAVELCDGIDNDCDGTVDEEAVDGLVWFADQDQDGFGTPDVVFLACTQPAGAVAIGTDCDDDDARTFPGAAVADSTVDCMTDQDEDGYGAAAPAVGVTVGSDCDDNDPLVVSC